LFSSFLVIPAHIYKVDPQPFVELVEVQVMEDLVILLSARMVLRAEEQRQLQAL